MKSTKRRRQTTMTRSLRKKKTMRKRSLLLNLLSGQPNQSPLLLIIRFSLRAKRGMLVYSLSRLSRETVMSLSSRESRQKVTADELILLALLKRSLSSTVVGLVCLVTIRLETTMIQSSRGTTLALAKSHKCQRLVVHLKGPRLLPQSAHSLK